jgi:ADP-ribose pyrophosphatase YjhB (NUDIX family)
VFQHSFDPAQRVETRQSAQTPFQRASRADRSAALWGRGLTTYFAADPTAILLSVSAVVWGDVSGGERSLLLMRRSDNGHWGLPGGYVERGESVTEAAKREVLEETGVLIDVGRLVGVYSDPARQVIAYPDGNRIQAVNLCFEGKAVGAGKPTTPEETLDLGYFPAGDLPAPFVPIHLIRIEDAVAGGASTLVR